MSSLQHQSDIEEDNDVITLMSLPNELLLIIFNFFDYTSLCAIAQVSCRCYALAYDNTLWLGLCQHHHWSTDVIDKAFNHVYNEPSYMIDNDVKFKWRTLYRIAHVSVWLVGLWRDRSEPFGGLLHIMPCQDCSNEYVKEARDALQSQLDRKDQVTGRESMEENIAVTPFCHFFIVYRNDSFRIVVSSTATRHSFEFETPSYALVKLKMLSKQCFELRGEGNFHLLFLKVKLPTASEYHSSIIPHSLTGLWAGSYGSSHGVEIVNICRQSHCPESSDQRNGSSLLVATKISGDPNVGAGHPTFHTFSAEPTDPTQPPQGSVIWPRIVYSDLRACSLWPARIRLAHVGYNNPIWKGQCLLEASSNCSLRLRIPIAPQYDISFYRVCLPWLDSSQKSDSWLNPLLPVNLRAQQLDDMRITRGGDVRQYVGV